MIIISTFIGMVELQKRLHHKMVAALLHGQNRYGHHPKDRKRRKAMVEHAQTEQKTEQDKDKKPKLFKIIVDQREFEVESPITGAQIRALVGVDSSYGVWQIVPGPGDDPQISDDQPAELKGHGKEEFFTGKKQTIEG